MEIDKYINIKKIDFLMFKQDLTQKVFSIFNFSSIKTFRSFNYWARSSARSERLTFNTTSFQLEKLKFRRYQEVEGSNPPGPIFIGM